MSGRHGAAWWMFVPWIAGAPLVASCSGTDETATVDDAMEANARRTHGSPDAAAMAWAAAYYGKSKARNIELGAAICWDYHRNVYFTSKLVTGHESGVRIKQFNLCYGTGATDWGTIHTHGACSAKYIEDAPSPQDLAGSEFSMTDYLVTGSGKVITYTPSGKGRNVGRIGNFPSCD